MKDFVSHYRTRLVALVAALSIVWIVYVPYGFPWAVLAFVGLVSVSAALLVARNPSRSIADLIEDIEAEPQRATVAAPMRVPKLGPKAIL